MARPELRFSPEGIVALCPELTLSLRTALLNRLDGAWDDFGTFEIEFDVPIKEHPYVYLLKIVVDPL